MVPLQSLRAPETYLSINTVNHFNFMNKTLLGRLWAPIARWFTILEMRFHLDIFRQQGLVTFISCRPPKTGFFISTSTSEGVSSSNTSPEKRKTLATQLPSLSLDPQVQKKRKVLQDRLRIAWILRAGSRHCRSLEPNLRRVPETAIRMGQPHP